MARRALPATSAAQRFRIARGPARWTRARPPRARGEGASDPRPAPPPSDRRPPRRPIRADALERAARHSRGCQNGLSKQLGKRPAAGVDEELLNHRVPAAGVSPLARCAVDTYWGRVRRRHAVEHLTKRRHRHARRVTEEAGKVEPGAVAEQAAQRDRGPAQSPIRHLPRDEPPVDVVVQPQRAVLDEPHGGHCGYGLADRTGLEQRGGVDEPATAGLGDSVPARPGQSAADR